MEVWKKLKKKITRLSHRISGKKALKFLKMKFRLYINDGIQIVGGRVEEAGVQSGFGR